jgi:PAS domain S-box-containing protein
VTDLATSDRAGIICVLHVDDDPCMLEVSKEILMMDGNFEIDHALSVEEAFKKLETQDYDVVISDYEMPQKNGLEFLKELRQQKNEIPFILFTGKGREEVVVKALNLGADRCINKNGSPETVYSELADAISKTVERKKSKQLLVESESKYRTVVEKSLQGILITLTSPLQLVFANDNMARILGYSTDELLSLSPEGITGLIFQQDRSVFFKRLQSRARGEQAKASLAFRAVRKDGSIIWLEAFSNLIEYEGRSAVLGMFLDISERKKADQILKESEARYRSLYESSFDGVMLAKPDGSILSANPQACRMLGMTEDEIKEAGREGIVVKDEKLAAALKEREQIGHIRAELTFRRKDGTTFVGEISSSIFKDAEGITKTSMIIRDITERMKAEKLLKDSAAMYRDFADSLPEIVFEIDADGDLVFVNQRASQITGYGQDEFGNNFSFVRLVAPAEREKAMVNIRRLMSGKHAGPDEFNLIRKDGSVIPVMIWATPRVVQGKVAGIRGIVVDISERQKAEEALRESDVRLKKISSQTPGMLYQFKKRTDGTYCVPFTTEAIQNIFGCSSQEVREDFSPIAKVIMPEDLDKVVSSIEYSAKHLTPWQCEYRVKIPGQQVRWVWGQSIPEKLADGSIIWHGYNADVTERKKAEENQKKLKAFDERIVDSLSDALLVINPDDYTIISANETALKQLKLRKEDLIGKTCYQTTHHRSLPCHPPESACPIREVLKTGNPLTVEHTHFDGNNNQRIVEVSARPVMSSEGKTVIIHIARDITVRKQMETIIQEAEKRYRALFDWAPLGILIIDPQTGKPVEFNEVAHEQLGYSREEFAKLRIYEYKADETPNETKAIMEKILREGKAEWETKHRTKNGEVRDVVIISRAIELSDRKLLQSIYRDVTEAKKIEAALMDSETKYRQLVELAQEGVWALDTDNCTVYVNPRMAELLGYAESEMIGKNIAAFLDNPDTDFAKQNLEGCKLGHQDQCEFMFIRKDGARINVSISASSIKDDEGISIGTLALVADITKRKKIEVELKSSHDKMETMNEKLRVVGGLTRHDVRNKLSAITGYSYLLKKRHADQADVVEGLDKMVQSVEEIEEIFEFAKAYEQLGAEELAFVNVGKALDEAKALFSSPLPKIVNDCHGLSVLADSFLRQMFYNFIDNTRKYGKTAATIKVYYEKTDEENLRLIYEDDGVGIHFENKQHLFKEGFSTGGSTGFGLFLINKMMDVYGWEIQETGEPGKGVRFVMTIPKTRKNGEINYRITQKDNVPSGQL